MIDLKNRYIALSDVAALLTEPSWVFKEPDIPDEILEENRKIQYKYGLDEADEFQATLFGWTIRFKPDAVTEGEVIEFKVKRRFSNFDRLYRYAFIQAAVAAYLLNKPFFRIVFHDFETGELVCEHLYRLADVDEELDIILRQIKNSFEHLEALENNLHLLLTREKLGVKAAELGN